MSAPAVLIATAKLRSGKEEDFSAWQARHNVSKTGSHLYKRKEQICETFYSAQLALNRKTHNTLE